MMAVVAPSPWAARLSQGALLFCFRKGRSSSRALNQKCRRLAAMLVGAVVQLLIVSRLGFVRLLGAGHIVAWVPMLLWLVPRLPNLGVATPFGRWLFAVVILDLAALAIDFVDVARYLAGDRRPTPGTAP